MCTDPDDGTTPDEQEPVTGDALALPTDPAQDPEQPAPFMEGG